MDRRVYNGAMSDDLCEYFAALDALEAELKKKDPNAWVTYFPVEGFYMASTWRDGEFVQLTGEHFTKRAAILEAMENIK